MYCTFIHQWTSSTLQEGEKCGTTARVIHFRSIDIRFPDRLSSRLALIGRDYHSGTPPTVWTYIKSKSQHTTCITSEKSQLQFHVIFIR